MFRRFLVPSDGSIAAEAAFEPAIDLVHRTHATLDLLMVRKPRSRSTAEDVDDEQAGSYLAHRSAGILASHGIRTRLSLLSGEPATSIHSYVRVHGIDLVVMGTRGAGWNPATRTAHTASIGSTARQLLSTLDFPILFVPPDRPNRTLDHALVCLDESSQSRAALAAAGVLLFQTAHATLLLVQSPAPARSSGDPAISSGGRETAQLAESVRAAWRSVSTRVAHSDHPAESVLDTAHEIEAGLLVASASWNSSARTVSPGASTLELLHRTHLPVLVFPAEPYRPALPFPPAIRPAT